MLTNFAEELYVLLFLQHFPLKRLLKWTEPDHCRAVVVKDEIQTALEAPESDDS